MVHAEFYKPDMLYVIVFYSNNSLPCCTFICLYWVLAKRTDFEYVVRLELPGLAMSKMASPRSLAVTQSMANIHDLCGSGNLAGLS